MGKLTQKKKNQQRASFILLAIVIILGPALHNHFDTINILVIAALIFVAVLFIVGRVSERGE
ncbi:hypothetical protein MUO14_12825 [Halobacillus shinanisalinarum]|uniref:Uncharacterized protein n=1 Tax=Halobacillus shinanisalinarum TaxID=2932258 RepID=A0ABY4GU20_9BACI|nr:hypothetical protein [Halobacillus shinanisalinarum]UOQ91469.1 hypothetical protein MUO14_12825 [Halobacillus shinanisalinarum]